ncbi:MAG: PLD nuclease N-terminal domain-containing protein [Pseudolysinimonas sp.]
MSASANVSTLPTGALVGLAVVLVVEVVLDVIVLVDLYRRPAASIVFGNKWIWVAVIVLVNLVGAILYIAIGRKPVQTGDAHAPARATKRSSAEIVDALYDTSDETTEP